jgi:hypothetical protein
VSDDLQQIADDAVITAAIGLAGELRENPWLGDRMRERYNLRVLADCRRIVFDAPGWEGKPRYRLVYRNEPSDGTPDVVRLIAVGTRESLAAYRSAAARLGSAQRGRRGRR